MIQPKSLNGYTHPASIRAEIQKMAKAAAEAETQVVRSYWTNKIKEAQAILIHNQKILNSILKHKIEDTK